MTILKNLINKLKKKKPYPLFRNGWDLASREEAYSEYISFQPIGTTTNSVSPLIFSQPSKSSKKSERINKKPVEVFKEIISEIPQFNVANLDEQIKLVKYRMKVLKDHLNGGIELSDEREALGFLEARKKYGKYKHLFQWGVATFSGVKNLCEKYEVSFVDMGSYYKTMPMEAIDQLEKYSAVYEKVRNDHPVLKLIIEAGPEKPEVKKDPILLASSPFGRWWYILGAWDKEVEIVDDLIYHGK